jgi:hypothetical protein
MLNARVDARSRIIKFIAELNASNTMTVPEPHLVRRLLDTKNMPPDIFTVLGPYIWDFSDYKLTCVIGELSKRPAPIGSQYIEITSIVQNLILVALDEENVEVFKYLLGSTAAWDTMWEDRMGFKNFRVPGDKDQFASLVAHLVCYRGKAGDPQWMGPGLKSYSSCYERVFHMSMGSGPIQQIGNERSEMPYAGGSCGDFLRAAMLGDRNPDVIIFLSNAIDWAHIIGAFLTDKKFRDNRALLALEATMRKIATTQIARWHCDSVRFLVNRVKWPGARVRFLEKALLKTIRREDLDPGAMAFLEELFS